MKGMIRGARAKKGSSGGQQADQSDGGAEGVPTDAQDKGYPLRVCLWVEAGVRSKETRILVQRLP